jgi:hypothetical protein
MSGSRKSIAGVIEAYSLRLRSRNPKTDVLRIRRESTLQVHGPKARKYLLRAFVHSAVDHFARNEMRAGRRFYDGAYLFGTKNAVRGALLSSCLSASSNAFKAGEHQAVWRLLEIAHTYRPESLNPEDVNERFSKAGVVIHELDEPSADQPLWRLHSLKYLRLLPERMAVAV